MFTAFSIRSNVWDLSYLSLGEYFNHVGIAEAAGFNKISQIIDKNEAMIATYKEYRTGA